MRDLEYLDMDILELHFHKDIEDDGDIDLEISINYTLNFDEDEHLAYGDCFIEAVDDQHLGKFVIALHTVGIFSYMAPALTDKLRKRYHKESVKKLHPLWRDLLLNYTRLAQVPELELEPMEVNDADIQLGSNAENLN